MGNESQAKVIFANGNGAKTTGDSLRETDTKRERGSERKVNRELASSERQVISSRKRERVEERGTLAAVAGARHSKLIFRIAESG